MFKYKRFSLTYDEGPYKRVYNLDSHVHPTELGEAVDDDIEVMKGARKLEHDPGVLIAGLFMATLSSIFPTVMWVVAILMYNRFIAPEVGLRVEGWYLLGAALLVPVTLLLAVVATRFEASPDDRMAYRTAVGRMMPFVKWGIWSLLGLAFWFMLYEHFPFIASLFAD